MEVIISAVTLLHAFNIRHSWINNPEKPIPNYVFFFILLCLLYLFILVIFGTCYVTYLRFFIQPKVHENIARMNQIASRSSNINVLAFHNIEETTFNILRDTLEDVPVKRLWITKWKLNEQIRYSQKK